MFSVERTKRCVGLFAGSVVSFNAKVVYKRVTGRSTVMVLVGTSYSVDFYN